MNIDGLKIKKKKDVLGKWKLKNINGDINLRLNRNKDKSIIYNNICRRKWMFYVNKKYKLLSFLFKK